MLWGKLNQTNRLIHCTGSYLVNKRYYNAWKQTPKEQREEYEIKFSAELANYRKANEDLDVACAEYGLMKIPNLDALKIEKKQLMEDLETIESASAEHKQSLDEMNNLINNYNKLLAPDIMIETKNHETKKDNSLGL